MGVIPAKEDADFRFLPGFLSFPHFIDAAPLFRSDLLPPEPARHFPHEGKTRKVGTDGFFKQNDLAVYDFSSHDRSLLPRLNLAHRGCRLSKTVSPPFDHGKM